MVTKQIREMIAHKGKRTHNMNFRSEAAEVLSRFQGQFTIAKVARAYWGKQINASRLTQFAKFIAEKVAAGEVVEISPKRGPYAATYRLASMRQVRP